MVLLKKQKALCECINTGKGKAKKIDCDDRGEKNKEEQKTTPYKQSELNQRNSEGQT